MGSGAVAVRALPGARPLPERWARAHRGDAGGAAAMRTLAWLFALVLVAGARDAQAEASRGSLLALSLLAETSRPELQFAQRTIDRTWGPSDDSLYHEVNVADWKSEPGALA